MADKIKQHFRDSFLLHFRTIEQLTEHGEWLVSEAAALPASSERRHWLNAMLRLTLQEITWRKSQAAKLEEGEA